MKQVFFMSLHTIGHSTGCIDAYSALTVHLHRRAKLFLYYYLFLILVLFVSFLPVEPLQAQQQLSIQNKNDAFVVDRKNVELTGHYYDLRQVLKVSLKNSPFFGILKADLAILEAAKLKAETYPYNPQLQLSSGARIDSINSASADFSANISQRVEFLGQPFDRSEAAEKRFQAGIQEQNFKKNQFLVQIQDSFLQAVFFREKSALTATDFALNQNLYNLSVRQLELGTISKLKVNLAAAEVGKASARLEKSKAQYQQMLLQVKTYMGIDLEQNIELKGDLDTYLGEQLLIEPLNKLTRKAQILRQDLKVLLLQKKALQNAYDLEKKRAFPDITVQAYVETEGLQQYLIGGGVSVPLKIFNRNQGAIARVKAQKMRIVQQISLLKMKVDKQVKNTFIQFQAQRKSVQELKKYVHSNLDANYKLLNTAFNNGKVSWTEVLILKRSFLQAQQNLLNAKLKLCQLDIELRRVSGTFISEEF